MARIRENKQKHLTIRHTDTALWRADLQTGIFRMFVCIINMPQLKENAP